MILGIDPAVYNVGWGIIEKNDNNLKYIASGCISSKTNVNYFAYQKILSEFEKILDIYKIQEVAIEDSFVNMNAKTSLTLGVARGVCIAKFIEKNIAIFSYKPLAIKRAIVGNGNATKEQIAYMIEQILNVKKDFKKLDETDALGIAITHALKARFDI